MYVCIYICMYVCMHVRRGIACCPIHFLFKIKYCLEKKSMHVRMYIFTYVHVYVCT